MIKYPLQYGDTLIEIWKYWIQRRGENRITWSKTSRSRDENQQQTQPTYDAEYGNRNRLVGGEHSHHYAILAPRSPFCLGTTKLTLLYIFF